MKEVTSAEFRRTYAHIGDAVIVTANGRPIGKWIPLGVGLVDVTIEGNDVTTSPSDDRILEKTRFNSRPFTPAPKKR